jgi:DNA ligase (NAD+)
VIQVGRTGVLTPVAVLKSVWISGTRVSRATLHNPDEIERKDIRIGDTVILQRAGDVIPQIVRVVLEKRSPESCPFLFPTQCPSCHSPVTQISGQVAKRCSQGFQCRDQAIQRLIHFVSRNGLNIDGLGEKLVERLYDNGWIRSPVDIFFLPDRENQLEKQEGWGAQSVQNLYQAIEESRAVSLDRVIYALGIPQVGMMTSRLLADHYQTLEQFQLLRSIDGVEHPLYQELTSLEGIGESLAEDILFFLKDPHHQTLIPQLISVLSISNPTEKSSREDSLLYGKILVFTGTLSSMSRSEAKALAESHGARVVNSVSQKVDFLISGKEAGTKLKDAQTLKIPILHETQWREILRLPLLSS